MFEHSFVEGRARTRRGWTVVVSFLTQALVIVAGLLVPLIRPEALPRILGASVLVAPQPPRSARAPASDSRTVQTAKQPSAEDAFFAPPEMPTTPVSLVSDPKIVEPTSGVDGGIGPGGPGSPSPLTTDFLWSRTPQPPAPPVARERTVNKAPQEPIRVSTGVQAAFLAHCVMPVYPEVARRARIEGTVVFSARIDRGGLIVNLETVSGHPLLVEAAMQAVTQWRYRPTLLSGEPVEVLTVIEVKFALGR